MTKHDSHCEHNLWYGPPCCCLCKERELQKDAERYRWLRARFANLEVMVDYDRSVPSGRKFVVAIKEITHLPRLDDLSSLDAAIDAAMLQSPDAPAESPT